MTQSTEEPKTALATQTTPNAITVLPGYEDMIPFDQGPPVDAVAADQYECKAHAHAKIPTVERWKFHGSKGIFINQKTKEEIKSMVVTILDKDHPRALWHPADRNNPWHDRLDAQGVPTRVPICRSLGLHQSPYRSPKIKDNPGANKLLDSAGAGDCGRCRLKTWIQMGEGKDDLPPLCEESRVLICIRYDKGSPHVVQIEASGNNSAESIDMKLKALSKGGQYSWINYRFLVGAEPFTAANGTIYQKAILTPIGYNLPRDVEYLQQQRSIYVMTQDKTSEERVAATGEEMFGEEAEDDFLESAAETFEGAQEVAREQYDSGLTVDDIPF